MNVKKRYPSWKTCRPMNQTQRKRI